MCHLACPAAALYWTFWLEKEAKWEESNVATAPSNFVPLKKCSPLQGFCRRVEGTNFRRDREIHRGTRLVDFEPQNVEFKRARKCECCKSENRKDRCLKNQQPLQGFCCSCEGRIYVSDRESPEMRTFECRALKMETFRRLEGANFAKKEIRKILVALAKGKPQGIAGQSMGGTDRSPKIPRLWTSSL